MLQLPTWLLEVKGNLLGTLSLGYYISAGLFCLMAISLMRYRASLKRNPKSVSTPAKWNLWFFLRDNFGKVFFNMMLMFLFFRFCHLVFGRPLTMEMAVVVGVLMSAGLDKALDFFEKRTAISLFGMDRKAYMKKLLEKSAAELANQNKEKAGS